MSLITRYHKKVWLYNKFHKINLSGPFRDFLFYVTLTTSYLQAWTREMSSIPNNYMQFNATSSTSSSMQFYSSREARPYMIIQYKKSCPQQKCLPRNSLIFRVYLRVRTCEVFLCFAPFVFLGFIVLASLCPLLYVTREFHRFFHRGWADPIFLDKLNLKGQPLQGRIWRFGKCRQLRILSVILTFDKILVINDSSYCGILADPESVSNSFQTHSTRRGYLASNSYKDPYVSSTCLNNHHVCPREVVFW